MGMIILFIVFIVVPVVCVASVMNTKGAQRNLEYYAKRKAEREEIHQAELARARAAHPSNTQR